VRSLVSNSIYAKMDRNGPPSANQVVSKNCAIAMYFVLRALILEV